MKATPPWVTAHKNTYFTCAFSSECANIVLSREYLSILYKGARSIYVMCFFYSVLAIEENQFSSVTHLLEVAFPYVPVNSPNRIDNLIY